MDEELMGNMPMKLIDNIYTAMLDVEDRLPDGKHHLQYCIDALQAQFDYEIKRKSL